jgi:uncharacterized protein (TIGR03435 family)
VRIAVFASIFLLGPARLFSQSPVNPAFELASIKPAFIRSEAYFAGRTAAGPCGKAAVKISGNRVTIKMISLCGLIRQAYGVQEYRITGIPKALLQAVSTNYYDIDAKAAGEEALTSDQALLMLRSLLEERFQLKLHRETRDLPAYDLVVMKSGSKLSSDGKGVCGGARKDALVTMFDKGGPGFASCQPNTSAAQLADMLTAETDRPVLDKTGLTGKYAFELHFTPDGTPAEPGSPPSLFTAVQEQLGLKLEPRKEAVEVLVIDRAERPTEN